MDVKDVKELKNGKCEITIELTEDETNLILRDFVRKSLDNAIFSAKLSESADKILEMQKEYKSAAADLSEPEECSCGRTHLHCGKESDGPTCEVEIIRKDDDGLYWCDKDDIDCDYLGVEGRCIKKGKCTYQLDVIEKVVKYNDPRCV